MPSGATGIWLEKVRHLAALEVHQNGTRGVAFAETEVVHAHHPHVIGFVPEGAADAVEEALGAHQQPELAGQPRPGLAAQGEGDPRQRLPAAVGAPGVDAGHFLQTLGEDPPLTGWFVAEELAYPNQQAHRHHGPGELGQGATVAAVDPARRLLAARTPGRGIVRRCMDGHQVCVERECVEVQVFGDGEAAAGVRSGPEVPPGRV
jgi:hypothetical protein